MQAISKETLHCDRLRREAKQRYLGIFGVPKKRSTCRPVALWFWEASSETGDSKIVGGGVSTNLMDERDVRLEPGVPSKTPLL